MTSDAVGVASQTPFGVFPKVSRGNSVPHVTRENSERHFRREWKRLTDQVSSLERSADVEERLAHDTLEEALDLAVGHPDLVDVTSRPFGETESDMVTHVRTHFRNAFEESGTIRRSEMSSTASFRTLIRACELVYLDDAVRRFALAWTFEPAPDDLDTLKFDELPDRLGHWMEQARVAWDSLRGDVDLSRAETRGLVEMLYGSRREFVEGAMELDLFLPVPPSEHDETGPPPNLEEQFARGHDIAPEDVHRYCYRKTLDDY